MFSHKKLAMFVVLMLIAPIALATCGPTPEPQVIEKVVTEVVEVVVTEVVEVAGTPEVQTVIETQIVEVTVPPPEETEEAPAGEGEAGPYRIALFEDPITVNWWSYAGPDSSVWTQYLINDQAPQLYQLADVTFQWVPYLAAGIAEPVDNGDGFRPLRSA